MERTKALILKHIANTKSVYTVFTLGVVWHLIPLTYPYMVYITPFFLFSYTLIALYLSFAKSTMSTVLIVILYLSTFFIEVYGVKTGLIFGEYEYLWGLQPQLFNVPLVIGLTWLSLIFGGYYNLKERNISKWLIILINPIIVTLFDVILEPVAIHFSYWKWEDVSVPLQNYIAWFVISLVITTILVGFNIKTTKNGLIKDLFYSQLIFFVLLLIGITVLPV